MIKIKPRVFGYVRLSRDDDDNKESIEGQKEILYHEAQRLGYEILDILEDDNYTGMNFDRPSIIKIEKMINNGDIDILLTKDLSRIGRHNGLTINFVENMVVRGVRLLTVADNFDSIDKQSLKYLGIKTFINEMYAQDISSKVLSKLKTKQSTTGLLVKVPYGYIKEKIGRETVLTIDEESKVVIELIYKLYLDGYGMKKISLKLNELGHDTPSVRQYKTMGINQRESYTHKHIWHETTIRRILINQCYIGILVNRKTALTKVKGKKVTLPKDAHIEHADFFARIISDETYYAVQEMMRTRKENDLRAGSNTNQPIYRYSSMLKCTECGKGFITRNSKTGGISYECSTHKRYGKIECSSHRISERDIDEIILMKIKQGVKNAKSNLAFFNIEIDKMRNEKKSYDSTIAKLTTDLFDSKEERKNYSRMLAKELIEETEFLELTKEVDGKMEITMKQLDELRELRMVNENMTEGAISTISVIDEIIENNAIGQKYIQALIKNIYITDTYIPAKYNRSVLDMEIEWQDIITILFIEVPDDNSNVGDQDATELKLPHSSVQPICTTPRPLIYNTFK